MGWRSGGYGWCGSRLPTSEIVLQFQMYVLEHYHAVDKHVEILSLDVFSDIS